jgi:hypothetical protein
MHADSRRETMKAFRCLEVLTVSLLLAPFLNVQSSAAPATPPSSVLFHNVRIFDGVKNELWAPADVLVQGNTIRQVNSDDGIDFARI